MPGASIWVINQSASFSFEFIVSHARSLLAADRGLGMAITVAGPDVGRRHGLSTWRPLEGWLIFYASGREATVLVSLLFHYTG